MRSRARRSGFTLLEVMLAVAIMAIALGAVFSAQAGSVKMAQRARMIGFATLLARCKMGEIEEDIAKKGLPASFYDESDNCCKDAPIDGFKCKWELAPIVLPDTMFGAEEDEKGGNKGPGGAGPSGASPTGTSSGSDSSKKGGLSGLLGAAQAALGGKKESESSTGEGSKSSLSKDGKEPSKDGKTPSKDGKQDPAEMLAGDPSRFLAGGGGGEVDAISAMAMQYVYPVLKPAFQSQIRRASVKVTWAEGNAPKDFELTQYVVAEQPVPLAMDPNDPNALLNAGGTTGQPGTGSTPGTIGSSPSSSGGWN